MRPRTCVQSGRENAHWTRGQLEGDFCGRPSDVVWVGIEDDWQAIALPRLIAAGADLERIHFVRRTAGGIFAIDTDLAALASALHDLSSVALIVIDPLDSHLGDSVDSHRKSEVQRSIQRLADIAQEHACAIVGIAHLNKNELSRDLLMRIIGSKGFTTAARSVLAVGTHPENEDECLLVLRKSNFTDRRSVPALRFRVERAYVEDATLGTIETARVAWKGEETIDADSILSPRDKEEDGKREEAAEWLLEPERCSEPVWMPTYWGAKFCHEHFKETAATHDRNGTWPEDKEASQQFTADSHAQTPAPASDRGADRKGQGSECVRRSQTLTALGRSARSSQFSPSRSRCRGRTHLAP